LPVLGRTASSSCILRLPPATSVGQESRARTPDIAPAFILNAYGKPFSAHGLGNKFEDACKAAGAGFRLHGLRKAFCVYWAEKGATANQIAAMAGHLSLSEVERYTRDADRRRLVELLMGAV
jgi:site-specific recombinase XerD